MTRIVAGLFVVWIYSCDHRAGEPPAKGDAPAVADVRAEATKPAEPPTPAPTKPAQTKPAEAKPAEPPKPAETPREPSVAYVERLGDLQLGMTADELREKLPTLVEDGAVAAFPPDGGPIDAIAGYGQQLKDDEASVSITIESSTRDGVYRATSIELDSGAILKTKQGIGIGATRRAVKKVYPKAIAPLDDELWVRFGDDEMLLFLLGAGKVERILLGPAMDPDDIEE